MQFAPSSQVYVQWPPEHSFVAFASSSAVNLQFPLGQLFLQSPEHSHEVLLIAPQATPTVGWLTEPLELVAVPPEEEVVGVPPEDVVPPEEVVPPLLEEVFGSGSSSRRLFTVQPTRDETITPAKIHAATFMSFAPKEESPVALVLS